jgi:hypothetical protein
MNKYEIQAHNVINRELIAAYMDGMDINLVDIIAANCGWNPLVKDEKMTVSFCSRNDMRRYEIRRIE